MAHRRIARLKARFRWRRIAARTAALCTTIRGRILVAFLVMCMITAALGAYATLGVRNAGLLVDKTFDESLMSINYARAAAADFAAMRAAFARRWIAADAPMRSVLDAQIEKLGKSLAEDLAIAAQRAQSARATRAAKNAVGAVDAWQDISRRLLDGTKLDVNWMTLDHYAAKVDEQIDLLVNYTAGDGFLYRQSARAAVARDIKLNTAGIALALLLSGMVAWTLARRIVGPVAVASGVAERIAAGKLDVAVPKGGADELGALLAAMGVMRDNIKAMMDREVAQRRSDRRQAEAKIVHMARHDALTNLPNRVLFRDTMEQALRRGEKLAVLFLDLDRFKSVNDTLGHSLGDALLCAVSERLQGIMGGTDAVARLGGDEFAILQANGRPNSTSELAAKVIEALSQPFEVCGHQLIIGTSIGIAMAPADGKDADQLLRNADMALYRAKAEGRGTFHFFQAEMDAQMQERRRLELDLRKALAAEEFELYYQPIIRVDDDDVCGFEALIRWNHPERGFVTPDAFIPLAEEIGLIVPLGEWVLKQACRDAAAWPSDLSVAVNLSAAQFRNPALAFSVVSALAQSGLAASRLELEITESVLLQDDRAVLETLHQIRGLGVRICMDDFGTGYSSLSYLRSFPFDKIKIDRFFTRELGKDNDCVAIIRAVIQLGASLGMITTAEGVETDQQLEILRAEGCGQVQGYLFSRPRPVADVPAMLRQHQPRVCAA